MLAVSPPVEGWGMSDIFFTCGSCEKHLVVDDAGAGVSINCPDCNAPVSIPKIAIVYPCPHCAQKLKYTPSMKGQRTHCSTCQAEVQFPQTVANDVPVSRLVQIPLPQKTKPTCPSCRKVVQQSASFCINCGTNLETEVKVQTVNPQTLLKDNRTASSSERKGTPFSQNTIHNKGNKLSSAQKRVAALERHQGNPTNSQSNARLTKFVSDWWYVPIMFFFIAIGHGYFKGCSGSSVAKTAERPYESSSYELGASDARQLHGSSDMENALQAVKLTRHMQYDPEYDRGFRHQWRQLE